MAEQCPYLEYRRLSVGDESGGDESGDSDPRPYCTAADEFVQAMRADVCNDRYGLDHETDCEIYRDHEGLPEVPENGAGNRSGTTDDAGGE